MKNGKHQNPVKPTLTDRIVSILNTGQTVEMPMLSGSMLPLLPTEAVVTITRLDWQECQPGMIGVFNIGGTLVAHRILLAWLSGPWGVCFQKGDNNAQGHWTTSKRIVGIVTGVRYCGESFLSLVTLNENERAELATTESLRSDLGHRVLYWPRRIKSWLHKTPRNSDSR